MTASDLFREFILRVDNLAIIGLALLELTGRLRWGYE